MKKQQSEERHGPAAELSLEELFMKLSPAGRRAIFDSFQSSNGCS
jgi:hypothetical protein